jgi:serine/threonine-protein kinase
VAARGTAGAPVASSAAWADLDVLCLTAMRADAQRRYQTVEALVRDVDHFLNGEPLDARPEGVRYRVGKFVRRHRAPIATASAVVAVIIGLVSFYTIRLTNARDTALAQAARAERVQRFTLDLFNGGDEDQGPADSLRVLTLLDRGVEQIQQLANEPAAQADMMVTIGGVFTKLGRFDRADSLLSASLASRRALFGSRHPDVAASLLALAHLREEQAKLPEAERLSRDALAMLKQVRPPGHPDIAKAMSELGRVIQARGAFPEAIAVLNEAVRLQSATGEGLRELAISIQTLAVAHFYAGHFAEADSLHRVGLALDRRVFGDRNPQVGSDIMDIGSVQFQRAKYVEAERAYREGVGIYETWFGKDHPQTAGALFLLGQSLIKLSRADEADSLLRRSLAIEDRVRKGPHPRIAYILNALGSNASARGHQAEAEQYYRRATDILRAVYGPDHYLVGVSLSNLGSTWMARQDYQRAERLFGEALAIYAKSRPAGDLVVGVTRVKLGRTLLRQARWRDAEPHLLAGYEIMNKQAPTSEWATAARDDLAATYLALGQPAEAKKYQVAVTSAR